MCNAVQFHERWFNTPEELATLVGGPDKLVWQSKNPFHPWPADKDWHVMDACLCPIDLAATLSAAGFRWTRGVDPMEWFAEKAEN